MCTADRLSICVLFVSVRSSKHSCPTLLDSVPIYRNRFRCHSLGIKRPLERPRSSAIQPILTSSREPLLHSILSTKCSSHLSGLLSSFSPYPLRLLLPFQ